jgi:DinB superfamily
MVATATQASDMMQGLDEFRATRTRTLSILDGLTQQQLEFAPGPNQWSAGEVLDHMLLAERANREQVAKLIELKRQNRVPELNLTFADLNVSVAGVPRCILPFLEGPITLMNMFVPGGLRTYLTRHRLIPFRNPDIAMPRRGRSAAELSGDLKASLQETEILLRNNADLNYDELILHHPLLGSYNIPGLLRFMAAHEERHQSQIDNILNRLRVDSA